MSNRTLDAAAAMSRRELARLQANEMSAALNPFPERLDDAVSDDEKAQISTAVADLRDQHLRGAFGLDESESLMGYRITEEEMAFLRRPHIARAWFAELGLSDGMWRVHNGVGRKVIGGQTWHGLSDPAGRQLVSISAVEEARFGQAAKVDIVLSGVNVDFIRSVKANARETEGSLADLYWVAFDQETQEIWSGGMKKLFPGFLSAPKRQSTGIGMRTVSFAVESLWHSQNFPFGGRWTPADQQRRYPGDKGLDFVGVKVSEVIKA